MTKPTRIHVLASCMGWGESPRPPAKLALPLGVGSRPKYHCDDAHTSSLGDQISFMFLLEHKAHLPFYLLPFFSPALVAASVNQSPISGLGAAG
jgi:hypothetical protein